MYNPFKKKQTNRIKSDKFDLVYRYKEYYRDQTLESFDNLFKCMLDYDFSYYHEDIKKIFNMHQHTKCLCTSFLLKTGGTSTGTPRAYEFCPNFTYVKFYIEGFLRLSHHKTLLISGSKQLDCVQFRKEIDNEPQNDYQVRANWYDKNSLDKFFNLFDELFRELGPINLCALPALWLLLTYNPHFFEWANKNSTKINALVNTDCIKRFKKVECTIRDQMIDWGNGLNFYSCKKGFYHFLPIFFYSPNSCVGLLNLKKPLMKCDDLVSIDNNLRTCECGLPLLEIHLTPHWSNFPITNNGQFVDIEGLYDKIPDYTDNFQIYQSDSGKNEIFYSCSNGKPDLYNLIDYLDSIGIGKINITYDKYFSVNNKKPLVWRGGSPSFSIRK